MLIDRLIMLHSKNPDVKYIFYLFYNALLSSTTSLPVLVAQKFPLKVIWRPQFHLVHILSRLIHLYSMPSTCFRDKKIHPKITQNALIIITLKAAKEWQDGLPLVARQHGCHSLGTIPQHLRPRNKKGNVLLPQTQGLMRLWRWWCMPYARW